MNPKSSSPTDPSLSSPASATNSPENSQQNPPKRLLETPQKSSSFKSRINYFLSSKFFQGLTRHVQHPLYDFLLAFVGAADNWIVIVPTDGLLISSSILAPKKWWKFASFMALGSTLGALSLAWATQTYGQDLVVQMFPGLMESRFYVKVENFFTVYGLWVVFVVAITPLFQQPTLILASLAHTELWKLAVVIGTGRWAKFLFMAFIGTYFPGLLKRLWGVQGELEDMQIKP